MKENCAPATWSRPGPASKKSGVHANYRAALIPDGPNVRKICFIQGCRNTSMRFPNLHFFEVPSQDYEAKKKWLSIAKREEHINNRIARWYCCEEHFDDSDIENNEQSKQKKAVPILKKDVVPHILPVVTVPSLPLPRKGNHEEWDKFKRRLIRAVSRLMFKEKKPEFEMWAFLNKETGCDCLLLWDRMRSLTLKKLSRLLLCDDNIAKIPNVARMTVTDWFMCDLVIVHEDIDVLGRPSKSAKNEATTSTRDYPALIELFSLVQQFNVEDLEGERLVLAWSAAAKHYNNKGRQCSPMLLQRRWYQLKEWTRSHFYEFWQSYRGNQNKFLQNKNNMPGKLQRAVARRFPRVITDRFSDWEQLINWEKVILPDRFEALSSRKLPTGGNDDDPDLILLEQPIETINVDSDDDSGSKDTPTETANNNELDKTIETQIETEEDFDPSKVKNEPIAEIDIDEHEFSKNALLLDSTRKALEEVDRAFAEDIEFDEVHVSESINNNPVMAELNTEEERIEEDSIENFDDTAQTGFEIQLPKITNVFGNIKEKEFSNLSSELPKSLPLQDEKIINIEGDKEDDEDVDTIDDIIKIKLDNFVIATKSNVQTSSQEDCLDIIQENVNNVKSLLHTEESIEDLLSNIDDSTDEVRFVDEGITFLDDGIEADEEDVVMTETDLIKVKKEDDVIQEEIDNLPKFDLKLLMEPVVYTTKLDQMSILRNTNLNTVYVKPIIDNILNDSKPVSKRSIAYIEKPKKVEDIRNDEHPNSDDSNDCINRQPEEVRVKKIEIEPEFDISYSKRIGVTSHLLHKPKNREYTPIQICKNPDFNTRLKRLNMGFYNHERNIQYLKLCKPLTIDLHKAFESKLIEGTLYLKPNENEGNKQPVKEDDSEIVNMNIVPFAGPVQSLMNLPKPTPEELLAVSSSEMPYGQIVSQPAAEEDDDVIQVSRLNSEMPQPCVLGRAVSPPKHSNPQIQDVVGVPLKPGPGRPPQKLSEYIDRRFVQKQKLLVTRAKPVRAIPTWSIKGTTNPNWKLDEFLIQPDTLTKMLLLMSGNDQMLHRAKTKNEKAQVTKLLKKSNILGDLNKTTPKPTEDNQICEKTNNVLTDEDKLGDSTNTNNIEQAKPTIITEIEDSCPNSRDVESEKLDKAIETEIQEIIDVDKLPSNITSKKKIKKQCKDQPTIPPNKYCCWARRKIANFGKKHYIKHNCPLDNCKCCCFKDFIEVMAEQKLKMHMEVLKESKKTKKNTTPSMPVTVQSIPKAPVAHIRIVPRGSLPEELTGPETNDSAHRVAAKARPSIVIDGTPTSMLSITGTTKSPIYVGKNKVLLTNMKFPEHLENLDAPEQVSPPKIALTSQLPPSVQLVMLPNGSLTFTVDPDTELTQDELDRIPKILSAVQEQLGKAGSINSLPIKNKQNDSISNDEIVISDDDEPSRTLVNTPTQVNESTNKAEEIVNTQSSTDEVNKTPVVNRNSLLSDLMQMSGIMLEDTETQPLLASKEQDALSKDETKAQVSVTYSSNLNMLENRVNLAGVVLPDVIPTNIINTEITSLVNEEPTVLDSSTNIVTQDPTHNILEKIPETTGVIPSAVSLSPKAVLSENPIPINNSIREVVEISTDVPSLECPVTTSQVTEDASTNENSNVLVTGVTISPELLSEPVNIPRKVTIKNHNLIQPNLSEFSLVTSFAKLKYVVENKGNFFKLDVETGILLPINVSLKRKVTIKRSPVKVRTITSSTLGTEEIDLTEETGSAVPNNSFKKILLPRSKTPSCIRLASNQNTMNPRPLKLIRAIPPNILRRKMNTSLLRQQDIIEIVKQKRKQRLMVRIIEANRPKPPQIEILDSDEDNEALSQPETPQPRVRQSNDSESSDESSDDEPLSKISKRIHNTDKSNETKVNSEITDGDKALTANEDNQVPLQPNEEANGAGSPMEVDSVELMDIQTEPAPKDLPLTEQCFIPGTKPYSDDEGSTTDESGDEDCILGV